MIIFGIEKFQPIFHRLRHSARTDANKRRRKVFIEKIVNFNIELSLSIIDDVDLQIFLLNFFSSLRRDIQRLHHTNIIRRSFACKETSDDAIIVEV